jgi:primary-amine oxidase
MLTPVNYFDYDITMESKNAILIHPPSQERRGVFEFDDNGVKQNFHCLPDAPPDFEYTEIGLVGVDGGFVDAERSADEIRRAQEMFVRLKAVKAL